MVWFTYHRIVQVDFWCSLDSDMQLVEVDTNCHTAHHLIHTCHPGQTRGYTWGSDTRLPVHTQSRVLSWRTWHLSMDWMYTCHSSLVLIHYHFQGTQFDIAHIHYCKFDYCFHRLDCTLESTWHTCILFCQTRHYTWRVCCSRVAHTRCQVYTDQNGRPPTQCSGDKNPIMNNLITFLIIINQNYFFISFLLSKVCLENIASTMVCISPKKSEFWILTINS